MGGACDHGTGSRGDNQVIWGVSLSMRACSIADAPDLSFEPLIYQPCQCGANWVPLPRGPLGCRNGAWMTKLVVDNDNRF